MAVTAKLYVNALKQAFNKEIDFDTDTIKVALLTNSYTPDQDADDYFSDISANEAAGTGYTAGGATLGSKTVTVDAGTNTVIFDGDDVSWAASTVTAHYAVVYVDTGTASTSALIGYADFGVDISSTAGTFLIQWDEGGIFTLTAA